MMIRLKPYVSIVVPLYNKAGFILKTVSSAACQIGCDVEIIVVDDGSTDDSAKLVKNAAVPHLRLVEQANGGVSAARNRGILAAEGKWIALLDADDLWSRDHLAGLLRAVEGSDAIGAFSNVRLQSRAGRPLINPLVPAQRINDYFLFALSNGGYPISASSIVILREELAAAGLFVEGVWTGEDIDMWCRLACRGALYYNAVLSAMYNDAGSPTRHGAGGTALYPLFARRLPEYIRDGKVPPAMADSSRRYANFLVLEYARQLLDAGRCAEARTVLLSDCVPGYDVMRFLKRLVRTSSVGRALYQLSQAETKRL